MEIQEVITVEAPERINRISMLPLVMGAVLLCTWTMFMHYPTTHYPAIDWFGNDVDYHLLASLATVLLSAILTSITYFRLRIALRSNQDSLRFATRCLVLLIIALAISLVLMVIPFVAAGWGITGYNDPEGYAPYAWGGFGRFLYSFAMLWCDTGFYPIISSLAAFFGILLSNPIAFSKLQRWSYAGIAVGSMVYVLFLLPNWPLISYWIFD